MNIDDELFDKRKVTKSYASLLGFGLPSAKDRTPSESGNHADSCVSQARDDR